MLIIYETLHNPRSMKSLWLPILHEKSALSIQTLWEEWPRLSGPRFCPLLTILFIAHKIFYLKVKTASPYWRNIEIWRHLDFFSFSSVRETHTRDQGDIYIIQAWRSELIAEASDIGNEAGFLFVYCFIHKREII